MDGLQTVADIGVSFNPKNWIADTEESFLVRLEGGSDPNDVHTGLSTELIYADSGGRTNLLAEGRARLNRFRELSDRIEAATKAGKEPDPEDVKALNDMDAEGVLTEDDLTKLQEEVSDDVNEYVWVNPWKGEAATGTPRTEAKTAKLKVSLYAVFGRKNIDPRVDGLLVCEAKLQNLIMERNGVPYTNFDGVLLSRHRITRQRSERGGFEAEIELQPFLNYDVFKDYMTSFTRPEGDDRSRVLSLAFFAPDEETYEWKPVYKAYFSVDYRFVSMELERMYHSPEYLQVGVKMLGEEYLKARDKRLKQIQGTLLANKHVAIFKHSPNEEIRFLRNLPVSGDVAAERATWLYGDASKVYAGPKRQRPDDTDLQDAMLQVLDNSASPGPSTSN